MSANRSIMPGGTRLVALIALAIVACLFAWRANTLLKDGAAPADAQTFEQRQLTSLLEPVFGANNVRVAAHIGADGNRQFLVLINSDARGVPVDRPVFDRVVTILEATAGYDRAADSLHIQPFAFAPGISGGFETVELYELGALGGIGFLVLLLVFVQPARRGAAPERPTQRDEPPLELPAASQVMRTAPDHGAPANEDDFDEARRMAAHDPKAVAHIVRRWIAGDKT
ncbi:hypothetical protein [Henriciella marina]|uniref:hypothetical protein n=1 Tax=Henriciella marina TaxID=453851 RepID=UPI0003816E02|nr:hypothetical protein [Henriciella marina]